MLTMFVTPISKEFNSLFKDAFKQIEIPLLISGNYDISNCPPNFEYIENPDGLVKRLKEIAL